jgi:hypothetical protein
MQGTQASWSNYVDPQKIKDIIEEKKETREKVEETIKSTLGNISELDLEKVKDYYVGNTPFPPLIPFTICFNGTAQDFLVPAFGPYNN